MTCKSVFGMVVLLLLSATMSAQPPVRTYVETTDRAKADGITVARLDSAYRDAVNVDTAKAVFKTDQEADSLIAAYTRFLKGFGTYLKAKGFKWGQPTKCWNRMYVNARGHVEFYLFNFKTPIDEEKLGIFKRYFAAYAERNYFEIIAPVNYAQCSPLTLMDE